MFVGEDLEVLSIASRRQESAARAPAVAQVVTRQQLQERGIRTLGQALAMTPGFHMAPKEWGTQPYLRGISDSVLFLYDTVPLTADTSKSIHPLDHDLSLAGIKRVEIIRGPGSVLWGPDAFAGIVNVVPMTGKDLDGVESGLLYETPGDHGGFFLNLGRDGGSWDGFLSLSGRSGEEDDRPAEVARFFGDGTPPPVLPEERLGADRPGRSRYVEAAGRFAFRDWFTLSGRIADHERRYSMTEAEEDLTWLESRSTPMSFLKLEAKRNIGRSSALRFTGYYSTLTSESEIIDLDLDSRESTLYGELIYDRSFLAGRSLLTLGASYRDRNVRDAPIWEAYLPAFLGPDNRFFLPGITEEDYRTRLRSFFGQYSHKLGDVDLWLGLRYDDHDSYRDHLSFSSGAVWNASPGVLFKLLYGTAYRTPFARQLLGGTAFSRQPAAGGTPELEKIETLSAQLGWKPSQEFSLNVTGFLSRLKNHIVEDPFAGLSQPNEQDLRGVEIEAQYGPWKSLALSANLTLLDNSGPPETYRFVAATFIRPDGTIVEVPGERSFPYDSGADTLFNLKATWRPMEKLTAFARLGYSSGTDLIFPQGGVVNAYPSAWLLDASVTVRDVLFPGLDLQLAARNLLDKDFEVPGTYSAVSGEPFSFSVMLRKRW